MGLLNTPVRLIRDLSIAFKLAMTVIGVLVVLGGLSWFASDRLGFVTSMQRGVAAQAVMEREVQHGLTAAQELRVVARELQVQQTLNGIRSAAERATRQSETVRTLLQALNTGPDQQLRDDALARLADLLDTVKHAATLRSDLLTARQKRLLQARPTFETAMKTLMDDLARGDTAEAGVASVRGSGHVADADQHDPAIEAANRYRLAMSKLQAAVMLFLATGNGSASNDIRDAVAEANAAMTVILSATIPDSVKSDARMVETIGKALAAAANDLVAMSRQLDKAAGADVEAASQVMNKAFEALAETVADRGRTASDIAVAEGAKASRDILMLVGAIALVLALTGAVVTRMVAGPIRRLTRIVQAIAGGKTDEPVPYTAWKDEIGRMAASVETLRGVMRQAFIQSQMIEQLPVGVMTAEPAGEFRITYVNAEARQILRQVGDAVSVPIDSLVGKSIDVFHPNARHQRELIASPANLPFGTRITLGGETLDLRISPMFDRDGVYAGPLVIWRQVTAQVRLVRQFEESVGTIARIVAESADSMCQAASAMRDSAVATGESTVAVSSASDQASVSVNAAASAAEELSMSVTEIRHQVAESARMANTAVAEAQATDASVGGLSEAAERISAVVSLISDIAGRTNLLALNATIEAARAGEAGKGFAIVAGEVKSLATQTAKATREISDQIAAMQAATGLAVTALRSISGTIQRMNEIAGVISGSVEQQALATQSIAEAVQHASAGTAEVNSNISAVARVVDETGERAGGVLQAATEVTGQAATLKQEVAKFLVAVQQAA